MTLAHLLTRTERAKIRADVLRGCALLDRRRPSWFKSINLDAFDLSSGTFCICGQLANVSRGVFNADNTPFSWVDGLRRLLRRSHINWTDDIDFAIAHGFTFRAGCELEAKWAYAERVWRQAIKARRAAKAAA